jgi:surface polysaccharide O-acyltransferase-like enzyme
MDEAKATSSATPAVRQFNIPLAYLRTFIIVLVVAQHAAMGYNEMIPQSAASSLSEYLSSMRAISPVYDEARSGLLSLFGAFNDNFFMALLFLLSGLFVWHSLRSRGRAIFLRDRLIRLGLPLAAMAVLRPLTYYPTYLQTGGNAGLLDFWQQWGSIEWRGGPIWFLEVLLIFNIIVVLVPGLKAGMSRLSTRRESGAASGPIKFFVLFVGLSAVAYIPMTVAYGSFFWLQCGPAQIQMNRLFLYAVYFLTGVLLGAYGIERTFLVPDSRLTRRWVLWAVAALAAFLIDITAAISGANEILVGVLHVLSSATISFTFLALFLRFGQRQRRISDSLFQNSYGIYVVHYGIVSWLLFALLGAQLPAMAKWSIVFPAALAFSWGVTSAIRRIPGVARVI